MNTQVRHRFVSLVAAAVLWAVWCGSAHAALSWQWVSGDTQYDLSRQLSMQVSGSGASLTVTFRNDVDHGFASSITAIYLDAPPPGDDPAGQNWLGAMTIESSSGVAFGAGATPPNLPGWANIDFAVSASADSNNPGPRNGVNAAGEYVALTFSLLGGHTVDDVLAALDRGDFRAGVDMQALPNGGSASYVLVPEPTTVVAGALLLVPFGVSTLRMLRKSRKA